MHTRIRCSRFLVNYKMIVPLLSLLYASGAMADSFRIQEIQVQGLQRIPEETVLEYLTVKPGDMLADTKTPALLRALYKTGFFEDIRVERVDEILQIVVVERPAVAEITIKGNKSLDDKTLRAALKEAGLVEGKTFNQPVLAQIERDLEQQFLNQGKYAVKIDTQVTALERNRVAIAFDIVEGDIARIQGINIVGNKVFSDDILLSEMQLSSGGWFAAFTKEDQYSKQKLSGDLEALRAFYLNQGYINFKIASTQVNITPDKSGIYITINVNEGGVYKLTDVQLAGTYIGKVEPYFAAIQLRRGEPFNRQLVVDSTERLSRVLSDKGYALAQVNAIPEVDEQNRTVVLTFSIDPGQRVYVRRVNIQGNSRTRDEVVRREFRQMESTWFSSEKLRLSRERAQRTGYFESIDINTKPVPGMNDQVDIDVTVKEKPSGSLLAGIGFSQSEGIVLNGSISQANFFGTGKQVSLALKTSKANQHYEVAYNNPYYTVDGISRGFQLSYRSTDFDELDTANYKTNNGIVGMSFGIPLSEFNQFKVGLKAHHIDLKVGSEPSDQVANWVATEGDRYLNIETDLSWRHDSRDSAFFPTKGTLQQFGMELGIPGSDLKYYKLFYKYRKYWALPNEWVFSLNGELGYGDAYGSTSKLPLFENFYVGGPKSVRGYESLSISPWDSKRDPMGGNMKVVGNAELYFPPFYSPTMRMLAFVDGGNVFDTKINEYKIAMDELRYSAGVGLSWLSPIGALTLSLANPLNATVRDKKEVFQFSFGTTF